MTKDTTSSYDTISTKELKQRGCFDWNMLNKQITITRDFNNRQLKIIIESIIYCDEQHIEITLIQDDYRGIVRNITHMIHLEKTKCNYGGYRYWFVCPVSGNRCCVLYLSNKGLACREALNLCYSDQNLSKVWRTMRNIIPDTVGAGDLYQTIKYQYRNGIPTRKYKKYLKMNNCKMDLDKQTIFLKKHLY